MTAVMAFVAVLTADIEIASLISHFRPGPFPAGPVCPFPLGTPQVSVFALVWGPGQRSHSAGPSGTRSRDVSLPEPTGLEASSAQPRHEREPDAQRVRGS